MVTVSPDNPKTNANTAGRNIFGKMYIIYLNKKILISIFNLYNGCFFYKLFINFEIRLNSLH